MECKEAERLISSFLDNEMQGRNLLRFIRHIEKCDSCKEELTIQYLASEGVARLEEGKTFDLDRELSEYINSTLKRQRRRRVLRIGILALEILAIITILFVFAYAML